MTRGRVALIGCGGIARGHIDAYLAMADRSELVYCVDVDESKARAFAEQGRCRWATDYRAVLDAVDAVDICTPPHLHAPIAIAAASQGKHVLTEKVMAITLEHHAPGLAAWRASWETFPMGCLLSHGCRYVDQMIWNFGEVVAASSMATKTVRGTGLAREDTAVATFRFANGVLGNFICSWAAHHTNLYIEFNVYGTDAFLHLVYGTDGVRRLERYVGKEHTALYAFDPRQPGADTSPKNFVGECEHFIDCIVNDKEPLTNGRKSRQSMAAILAAYQGDDEDRIIPLDPATRYAARLDTWARRGVRAGGSATL